MLRPPLISIIKLKILHVAQVVVYAFFERVAQSISRNHQVSDESEFFKLLLRGLGQDIVLGAREPRFALALLIVYD